MMDFRKNLLATTNLFVIALTFVIFTVMEDKISYLVLDAAYQLQKNPASQVLNDGERLLNLWLLMCTVCVGTFWLMREQLTIDFNGLILQQREAEDMLSMQIHVLANMGPRVVNLEERLQEAVERCAIEN
ncbi:uncharacterized protein [Drosophila virilis]|uniref:Uncharacterized protein n=1 Tax=Drosophila virilis TaxID=7244 RepID=B4MA67_DROVI|nr:uncharacterized protein LOC6634837 [Drosophila virilis]EDW66126.1 uncharacterized protein Dvir_GJ15850 [Drosophila virilis]